MKKMLLIILGLFIHMKSYPNEHILIKVNAKCNFEDTLFKNCSQNDFRKLIDTSSQYDENVNFFHQEWGFYTAVILMLVIPIGMLIAFRKRGWF